MDSKMDEVTDPVNLTGEELFALYLLEFGPEPADSGAKQSAAIRLWLRAQRLYIDTNPITDRVRDFWAHYAVQFDSKIGIQLAARNFEYAAILKERINAIRRAQQLDRQEPVLHHDAQAGSGAGDHGGDTEGAA